MAKKKRHKLKPMIKLILLAAIIGFIVILCLYPKESNGAVEDSNDKESESHENSLSLIMAGDALIHSSVYDDAYDDGEYNFDKILSLIKPIVKEHDLAFYNQETILGGTKLGLSSYPSFNSPQEVGEAFTSAGFNIVSLANNHTLDRGRSAIISSNNYWKTKKDVLVNGSSNSLEERNNIKIKEMNGIKYTLLAYTTTTNGIKSDKSYYVNIYSEQQVKKDIQKVRDQVDLLLVSMHWGEEYSTDVTQEQEKIANYLSNLGVDIIIGHHPHVIEPIDYIDDTLVIYSLGNFLSGQEGLDRRIGLMVSVDIKKVGNEINISAPTSILTYTHYKSSNVKTNFKVYPFSKLNNTILPGYKSYYEDYMGIITERSGKIIKSPL